MCMDNKKEMSSVLIKRIKPSLAQAEVAHASIDLSVDDTPRLKVEFYLTSEIIKAMQKDGEK